MNDTKYKRSSPNARTSLEVSVCLAGLAGDRHYSMLTVNLIVKVHVRSKHLIFTVKVYDEEVF